jgi:hypothetical protein
VTEADILAYVRASAALQGLPMDAARAQRVAEHMARTAHLAQLLEGVPLAPEDEIAEIYSSMPFPPTSDMCK